MSYEKPIIVPNDAPQALSRAADDVKIARLLAPNGFPTIVGECYSQAELDVVTEVVLVLIRKYCHKHLPRSYIEQEDRIQLFREIRDSFTMTNLHILLGSFYAAFHSRALLDGQDANQDNMMELSNSSSS